MPAKLRLPDIPKFSELDLEREPITGRLLFASAPLAAMCRFNSLDSDQVLSDEDLSCWLICEWYCEHRGAGGESDPLVEKILEEVAETNRSKIAILKHGGGQEH